MEEKKALRARGVLAVVEELLFYPAGLGTASPSE